MSTLCFATPVTENRNFVVISAVRNEGQFFGQTLETVTKQSLRPLKWVIVDDGSSDRTRWLAEQFVAQQTWIEVIARADRGFRQSGVGVVEAFYEGFRRVEGIPWDYVVKLDGDIRLPLDYFARITREFEKDLRLGICSGDIFNEANGQLRLDSPSDPAFHVRGAAKVYRRACWEAIGGMPRVTGFDCIDNVKARMLGWDTRRITTLKVIHLRQTGGAEGGWRNGVKDGMGANAIGYHPIFLVLKCLKRLAFGPARIVGLGQLCGYLKGYYGGSPRIDDRDLIRYLRRQQLSRLLGRETIWR